MKLPEITLSQIKARASGKVFSRGEGYYRRDAITNPIRRDQTIEWQCAGSYAQPYRVRVEFVGGSIESTYCNCEYDWGGDCKHIVALLLTYLHEPEQFEERQPVIQSLSDRSKEDLIDIIQQMLIRYPDLQSVIDRPSPTQVIEGTVEMDTLTIRQELRDAFSNVYSEYYDYDDYRGYGTNPVSKIQEFRQLAKRFSDKGDWLSASQIYRAILEEFAEMEQGYFYDEEGYLAEEVNLTVSDIALCLEQDMVSQVTSERQAVLLALLGVKIWDTEFGGLDIGWESHEIILNHVQPDDIPTIRKIVEDVRDRQRKKSYGEWSVESYTRFLMELDVLDNVDSEVILKKLYDEGMDKLLIRKLLELGRVAEAVDMIKQHITGSHEMLQMANMLVAKDQSEIAQQLVEDHLGKKDDDGLTRWMIDYHQQQQNIEQVLRWQQVLMAQRPSRELYADIKGNAQALNQWDTVQPALIKALTQSKRFVMLTYIYLMEEEWELAWQILPKARKDNHGWIYAQQAIELEVADATMHVMPNRAVSIYKDYIQKLIDRRGRDNYQQAATLLLKVRQIYRDLREHETWNSLIQHIRTDYKRLPALQDELKKAGL